MKTYSKKAFHYKLVHFVSVLFSKPMPYDNWDYWLRFLSFFIWFPLIICFILIVIFAIISVLQIVFYYPLIGYVTLVLFPSVFDENPLYFAGFITFFIEMLAILIISVIQYILSDNIFKVLYRKVKKKMCSPIGFIED